MRHPPFAPGNKIAAGHGRPRGAKNRLQSDFLNTLAADFAEHGADVIKIARIEEPVQYLRIVAGLMPKELLMARAASDLSDDELDTMIEAMRERVITVRQEESLDLRAEPLKVLPNGHAD